MKRSVRFAVAGGVAVLLMGTGLALSSGTAALSASRVQSENSTFNSIKCSKPGTYCLFVQNTNPNGSAIEGLSQKEIGVVGGSGSGNGVAGISTTGNGVAGVSLGSNGAGGSFTNENSNAFALFAQTTATGGYPFEAQNSQDGGVFYVDGKGDGYFSGSVTAVGGYHTLHTVRSGPALEAFSAESTRATIEDTGTARLEHGQATVHFDYAFASTIDARRGYQVFLTPNGETRGWLYVAAKYDGGFTVREAEHGFSSIDFDYRVVAHPYGATDMRLPRLIIKTPPVMPPARRQ